ncbi:transglycosylase SLT domain-containing protein [Polynucleobacter antarcticus]|uniref:Lytic transglycosylase n=1 Tax=Polynucleobacter antarcticus TaxID=1743162 RepID=A0A6M9PRZ1_9BURK|nr:transglycosylase SLT domain-containing protein [Polynucleobacter antarcticus]QKM62268.1 lytic transglycosylase [Polynucleobacter antarcticus]
MIKCFLNNVSNFPGSHSAITGAKLLLTHTLSPIYRVMNGLLALMVFMVVGFWLSGNGTQAGVFDLARILVPEEARQIVWQSGAGMLDQYQEATPQQQKIALLMPSVAHAQVRPISHLSDRIPTSKIDPQAQDSKLMVSVRNQRAVADFFEKKYNLDRTKIEEYVSNAVFIANEVNIDPVLLLAVISVESNFNPAVKSHAGAEGLMQVMTLIHKDKYALYGGIGDAVKPEVNIRVGAYILKHLIANAGSLRNGLKYYVGAANAEHDGGYADKVIAERDRLIALCQTVPSNKLTLNGKDLRS